MLVHCASGVIKARPDPAIRGTELNIASAGRRGIHQYIASGVPQFVAEVLVAFDTSQVEANVPARRRQGSESEAHGVSTILTDSVRKLLARYFFDSWRQVILHHSLRTLHYQGIEIDAVDQVDGVENITLRFGHLLTFLISNQAVDIDLTKRHVTHEFHAEHDHARDPEKYDVESSDENVPWVKLIQRVGLFGPAKCTERP